MKLRTVLVAGIGSLAAAVLALGPAAHADPTSGPIASVAVGGSTATTDYDATLSFTSGTMTLDVFGSPEEMYCVNGSITGTVHAGNPAPATFMNLSSLGLGCDGWGGGGMNMSIPANGCATITMDDDNVHDGTVDTGWPPTTPATYDDVDGSINFPPGCEIVVGTGSCTWRIGGSTPVAFDENVVSTSPAEQTVILKGSGLVIVSASLFCFGAISVGDAITLNDLTFSTSLSGGAGAIDFRPST